MLRGNAVEECGPKGITPDMEIEEEADCSAYDETGDWWGSTEEFFELDEPVFPDEIEADSPPEKGRSN